MQKTICILLLIFLYGCGVSDIKDKLDGSSKTVSSIENTDIESNESNVVQTAQENECYDWQTDCTQQTSSADSDIQQTTSDQTIGTFETVEQTTQDGVIIDPNACNDSNSSLVTITDNYSTPEGDSKSGVYFSSKITPSNVNLTLYFEKENNLTKDTTEYEPYRDDNLEFRLTTDNAYLNGKYIYIKRSDTMKCYRSKFASNLFHAILEKFTEVTKDEK